MTDPLHADVAATIKYVLSTLEWAAAEPPEVAAEPVKFNHLRREVIRRIWALVYKVHDDAAGGA